jgi:hypothetical protein
MATYRVKIEIDAKEVLGELGRLAGPPPVAQLEALFLSSYSAVKAAVHIETGSLKGSGLPQTTFDGSRWESVMKFGGASPGFPHNPVKYAIYELARHGAHDFFYAGGAYSTPDEYKKIIEDHLGHKGHV